VSRIAPVPSAPITWISKFVPSWSLSRAIFAPSGDRERSPARTGEKLEAIRY
jgi:hypothetical protein